MCPRLRSEVSPVEIPESPTVTPVTRPHVREPLPVRGVAWAGDFSARVSHPVPLPRLPPGIECVLRRGDLTEPHLEVDSAAHGLIRHESQILEPAWSFGRANRSERIRIEQEDSTPARRSPRAASVA
jgi:hypothetical protein